MTKELSMLSLTFSMVKGENRRILEELRVKNGQVFCLQLFFCEGFHQQRPTVHAASSI